MMMDDLFAEQDRERAAAKAAEQEREHEALAKWLTEQCRAGLTRMAKRKRMPDAYKITWLAVNEVEEVKDAAQRYFLESVLAIAQTRCEMLTASNVVSVTFDTDAMNAMEEQTMEAGEYAGEYLHHINGEAARLLCHTALAMWTDRPDTIQYIGYCFAAGWDE